MAETYFEEAQLLNPPLPLRRAAYSDRVAWLMAQMSHAAYIDNPQQLKEVLAKVDFELLEMFSDTNPNKKENTDTQAFLAIRKVDRVAVLAFRGTKEKKDIWTDLSTRVEKTSAGTAHTGFTQGYESIKGALLEGLAKVGDYALYITGHSLGGALAAVSAALLTNEAVGENLAACYTFGAPRVGRGDFVTTLKAPVYRVVDDCDVVPCLPLSRGGWWCVSLFGVACFTLVSVVLGLIFGWAAYAKIFLSLVCFLFVVWAIGREILKRMGKLKLMGSLWGYVQCETSKHFIHVKKDSVRLASDEPWGRRWLVNFLTQGVKDHDIGTYADRLGRIAKARNAQGCVYAAVPLTQKDIGNIA